MNLFNDIEKLSGENFSSAILRHLSLRSSQIREALLDLISSKAPDGPITCNGHFSVSLEQKTESDGKFSGRIDLIIEVDDAVIGIENKLNAHFQSGQPENYLPSIRDRRKRLAELKNVAPPDSLQAFILVLAPMRRETEIVSKLNSKADTHSYTFCSWEELFGAFNTSNLTDPIDRYLVKQLQDFVNERTGFPPNIARILPHLSKKFSPRGSDLQKGFVNTLWSSLPEEFTNNYSWGAGNNHCGYYINTVDEKHNLWYGFIDRKIFNESPQEGAAFIMSAKNKNVQIDSLVEININDWTENGWRCWEIPFKDNWTTREQWENSMQLFFRSFI